MYGHNDAQSFSFLFIVETIAFRNTLHMKTAGKSVARECKSKCMIATMKKLGVLLFLTLPAVTCVSARGYCRISLRLTAKVSPAPTIFITTRLVTVIINMWTATGERPMCTTANQLVIIHWYFAEILHTRAARAHAHTHTHTHTARMKDSLADSKTSRKSL